MLHFFSKKKYITDHLKGFVDIHNHLLPGIDDGAGHVGESIDLIKSFESFGVTRFISTPHIIQNYHPNNSKTINRALAILKKELEAQKMRNITVEAAAEHMIDAQFEELLRKDEVMRLKKFHLLIEMSYLQPSLNFDTAVAQISSAGMFPILAHPERYGYLGNARHKYQRYKDNGVLFQLNLLSLGEYYGKDVKQTALWLLEKGYIDFLGSDIHNAKQMDALKNIQVPEKTLHLLQPIIQRNIETFY